MLYLCIDFIWYFERCPICSFLWIDQIGLYVCSSFEDPSYNTSTFQPCFCANVISLLSKPHAKPKKKKLNSRMSIFHPYYYSLLFIQTLPIHTFKLSFTSRLTIECWDQVHDSIHRTLCTHTYIFTINVRAFNRCRNLPSTYTLFTMQNDQRES